jgi:TRAP transporter TAXI family solute receptor
MSLPNGVPSMVGFARRSFLTRSLAAACAAAIGGRAFGQVSRITIGANPAGTNFNLVAGGFAKTLQESLGLPSIVRPYSGSSVYIPMLQRGEITLGINSSIDSYLSYTGQAPYVAAMTNLRGIVSVYPLGYMYWVRANSGLRRVEDLEGKRVVLDYRSLVPLGRLNRAILATGGLGESDVVAVTAAGLPEGARIVAEGRADAVAMGYRLPLVAQMDAALSGGLRFLAMGSDESKVAELMPGAGVITVSPGAQVVGIDTPTRLAVYDTYLNTGIHLTIADVHRIIAALYAAWENLRRDYSVLATIDRGSLAPADPPHPYHEGAVQYFREAGLWTAAHEENQARLLARA